MLQKLYRLPTMQKRQMSSFCRPLSKKRANRLQPVSYTHLIFLGSMFRAFPWKMWLSIMAASRLLAAPMAWKSPVKCRLISSIGTTCAYPPPAAPPFTPKTGPKAVSYTHLDVYKRQGRAISYQIEPIIHLLHSYTIPFQINIPGIIQMQVH